MTTLTVGQDGTEQFGTIASAVAAANPGDTIDVNAGTYNDDFLGIYQDLTLQAVGGPVVMTEDTSPDNGKAMVDEGGAGVNVTINGFDISGVSVGDGNGAAVRYEGGNLTLNQDYFHSNQEGLLAADDPNGTITINDSEFAPNGDGSGSTHNIYVNNLATLTVENSYIHDAVAGHDIKSRAETTIIQDNRIQDDTGGSASYEVDIPNGGNATITGNVIEKGPNAQNPFMIAYGEEGVTNAGTDVSISNNTFVDDFSSPSSAAVLNQSGQTLTFDHNQVWGLSPNQLSAGGPVDDGGTTVILASRPSLDDTPLQFTYPSGGSTDASGSPGGDNGGGTTSGDTGSGFGSTVPPPDNPLPVAAGQDFSWQPVGIVNDANATPQVFNHQTLMGNVIAERSDLLAGTQGYPTPSWLTS
jgi:hypothetical protein